MLIKQSYRIV